MRKFVALFLVALLGTGPARAQERPAAPQGVQATAKRSQGSDKPAPKPVKPKPAPKAKAKAPGAPKGAEHLGSAERQKLLGNRASMKKGAKPEAKKRSAPG